MKRVLVVHYSQTGQLAAAVAALLAPLRQAPLLVHELVLQPQTPFPFPWPFWRFLDVFPECVRMDPPALAEPQLPDAQPYDLIVLAYQVWFLSPSLPMTAFLQSAHARRLLQGRAVVSLVVCRNMWLMAQEKMKKLVAAAGGELRDHIALSEPPQHILSSLITTPRWLLTGRRDAFWGLPPAGIAAQDIAGTRRFGQALAAALSRNEEQGTQPMLRGLCAAPVEMALILSERAGQRSFWIWSGLLRACGAPGSWTRRAALLCFVVYLLLLIVTVVPLSLLLQRFFAAWLRPRLARLQQRYQAPSGAEHFNMHLYG